MQITYKRNGLRNYMVVKHERIETGGLREKMMIRNDIPHLTKMIPQSIDGHTYYYYDIQGRVSLSSLFQGGGIRKEELDVILNGLGELLSELQRYMLTPDEVIFDPSAVWVSPDTLEPSFIYVPGMTKTDGYDIRSLAEFLAGNTDGSDREAAAKAFGYLERVENGYILPDMGCSLHDSESRQDMEDEAYAKDPDPPIDPDDYWDLKEGISDEMKPFFEENDDESRIKKKKKTAYICLGAAMTAAVLYIAVLFNPTWLPVALSEEQYLLAGAVIAVAFAVVLIGVMLMCRVKRPDRGDDRGSGEKQEEACFRPKEKRDVEITSPEPLIRETADQDDEKTVLIRRPGSFGENAGLPSITCPDGKKLIIRRFPFVMGKMTTRVDGVINGEGISRIHAMIKELDGRYYVSDLNSLNGTSVNGGLLNVNETREIWDGDSIELAETTLIFRTGKAGVSRTVPSIS